MTKRTASATKRADEAFPTRVKFKVPPDGLGSALDGMHAWLSENVPRGAWAVHSAPMIGGSAMAVHLIKIEDAANLVEAFPHVALAYQPSGGVIPKARNR